MTFVYELGGLLSRDSEDIQLKTPRPFADAAESLKMLKDDPKVPKSMSDIPIPT